MAVTGITVLAPYLWYNLLVPKPQMTYRGFFMW